jgi:septum site-determining protein MinC
MKTKQRNIRVFEIECDNVDAVRAYIEKNRALLEGLTLFLKGSKAGECISVCSDFSLCYAIPGECDTTKTVIKKSAKNSESKDLFDIAEESQASESKPQIQEKVIEKIVEKVVEKIVYVDKIVEKESDGVAKKSTRIIKNSTVRSGEDIVSNGDVSVFSRVNSGAKIKADGCVEIFDIIDGLVECGGEYMLIKGIGKGTVFFNGTKLDPSGFNGKLKKVSLVDGKLEIKEI